MNNAQRATVTIKVIDRTTILRLLSSFRTGIRLVSESDVPYGSSICLNFMNSDSEYPTNAMNGSRLY
jgi:hypothetical protein